jgi:CRISPR type IV-associated protein Csf3
MTPFTLMLHIGTPFCVPNKAIHLDGLLWYCLGARFGLSDSGLLKEKMKSLLAFDDELGVFCGSSMIMVATPEKGVVACGTNRVDDLRSKLERGGVLEIGKKKSIVVNGGPTKKRLKSRDAYYASIVAFHAIGKPESVKSLLENLLPGIGIDARTGSFGEVRAVDVITHDDNRRWKQHKDQSPARNLPLSAGIDWPESQIVLTPPYWRDAATPGFAADRIVIESITAVSKK